MYHTVLEVVNPPSTSVRSDSRDRRWHQILRASARLFAEQGCDVTTLRAIGDAVDTDPSNIYNYFRSKEDMLFEILRRFHAARLRSTLNLPIEGDALDRIDALCRRHFSLLVEWFEAATIVAHDGRRLHPARLAEIEAASTRHVTRIRDLIEDGRCDGLVRSEVDPAIAAAGLLGMAYELSAVGRRASDPSAVGAQYAALVVAALRAR